MPSKPWGSFEIWVIAYVIDVENKTSRSIWPNGDKSDWSLFTLRQYHEAGLTHNTVCGESKDYTSEEEEQLMCEILMLLSGRLLCGGVSRKRNYVVGLLIAWSPICEL